MLNEFRSTSITWDKATRRIYSPITANASDSNGRKLNIQVVNSGQVENLTGATLHLYWETKDKVHDGLDVFDVSDISKGEFELFYTTGMLSNVGELNATLVLVDSTGKVVSDWFKITVTRGINESAIESENSFSSLTQALIDISNLEQNYAPRLNDLTAQLQQTEQSLNAQLAQYMQELDVRTPKRFGEIKIPNDFTPIDFKLTRFNDGKVYHDINLDTRWRNNGITHTFHVDTDNGTETNDGLTELNAVRTLNKALSMFEETPSGSKVKIIVSGKFILRNETMNLDVPCEVLNKTLIITTKDNKRVLNANGDTSLRPHYYEGLPIPHTNLTWTNTSGEVYQTSRSKTLYVIDNNDRDVANGNVKKMKKVSSISECQSNAGSYFITGSTVYVHTFDSRPVDGDVLCVANILGETNKFNLTNGKLFIENMDFYFHRNLYVSGNLSSELILNNCDFGEDNYRNSVTVESVGKVYNFGTSAHDSYLDGFNYHYTKIPLSDRRKCLVFEYDCFGYNNGNEPNGTGNNFTTAHEGVSVLRVNSVGHGSQGVTCADVNGCYSILIDCKMDGSRLPSTNLRASSYQFSTDIATDRTAKAVLINSSGKSPNWSIFTDPQTELILEGWFDGLDGINQTINMS